MKKNGRTATVATEILLESIQGSLNIVSLGIFLQALLNVSTVKNLVQFKGMFIP